MRVLRIDPFESLTSAEIDQLRAIVADLPEELEGATGWLDEKLVVYVTDVVEQDGCARRIVAPSSSAIGPGDWVSAAGWTGTLAIGTNAPQAHGDHALHAAGTLSRRTDRIA